MTTRQMTYDPQANHNYYLAKGQAQYRAVRDARLAAGLTVRGTPRKRPYQFLTGWTKEQRKKRQQDCARKWQQEHRKKV